ncbi:MAG: PEP-utilizing enzyme [Patescibacteria group bacterium]
MSVQRNIRRVISRDWYIQGFNSVPLFLASSAVSGIYMADDLGYGYSAFVFHYRNGYGEMAYLNSDIRRIWLTVTKRLSRDADYLKKCRQRYEKKVQSVQVLQRKMDRYNIRVLTDTALLTAFRDSYQAQINTVGVGHLVESIGVAVEKDFKMALMKAIGPRLDFNQLYARLTAPSKPSFISRQESALHAIALAPRLQLRKRLHDHVRKYYWIQNSYTGPKHLLARDFERRLHAAKSLAVERPAEALRNKRKLITSLKLNTYIQKLIHLIDFTTIWQDDRKANILKNITYLDRMAREVSRRARVPLASVYHLGVNEVAGLYTIKDVSGLAQELLRRRQGCLQLLVGRKEYIASGQAYIHLLPALQQAEKRSAQTGNAIHGTIANGGTAVGRAVVCRNIASIPKVGRGDIIVASMTRPEFMPALKKAAAIVTDEGGITCHAAIVARELNIPCVIGTKVGTKVLRDGMTLEVRANHGIVKVIR